jgi:hypothetical protein
MSYLHDQMTAGFAEAFGIVHEASGGEQGGPVSLTFDGKTVDAIAGPLEVDLQMLAAGMRLHNAQQAVIKMADFDTLNLTDEDEVELDGRTLRVIKIVDREYPFVTVMLGAPR